MARSLMDKLLPYYQSELADIRRDCGEFAARHPQLAAELMLAGEASKDPHIERLIQHFALIAGRLAQRLDDDHPHCTEAVLESTQPHYLRSMPSAAVVHVDAVNGARKLREPVALARGTVMTSADVQGVRCQFSTVYDTLVAPAAVTMARFDALIDAPAAHRLLPGVGSAIHIAVDGAGSLPRLRLFIDGDAAFCAALRDTLMLRASSAYVSTDDGGPWTALDAIPLSTPGSEPEQAWLPSLPGAEPAYRLLSEYFLYRDKARFIDLDVRAIVARLPHAARRFTVHLALQAVPAGSGLARTLTGLSAASLLSNCVPIVNLFRRHAAPVSLHRAAADHALLADAIRPEGYEIYSIDSATVVAGASHQGAAAPLHAFYGKRHGQGVGGQYWIMRRDAVTAGCDPGREIRIALVDEAMNPLAAARRTLLAQLTCSNRNLPAALAHGAPDGDLSVTGMLEGTPVRLLDAPTPAVRFGAGDGVHWRLIAHLSLHERLLSGLGVAQFRAMLLLYDVRQSPVTQRQIAGIAALESRAVMAWIACRPCAALMPGIEIRLTLDEAAYAHTGVHAFAETIDRFFGLYAQPNVFTQLVVLSQASGATLWRCAPRTVIGVASA